jgi:hypothetical protein
MSHSLKKMTLTGLILMIFTSVFGFANSPSAFLSDGLQRDAVLYRFRSVLLYPVCADDGGDGLGLPERRGRDLFVDEQQRRPAFAFIGTFMWFSSYVWMVSTAAKVWVPFSTFFLVRIKRRSGLWRG